MISSPGDKEGLQAGRLEQTWAQPFGWPLSHQVCMISLLQFYCNTTITLTDQQNYKSYKFRHVQVLDFGSIYIPPVTTCI